MLTNYVALSAMILKTKVSVRAKRGNLMLLSLRAKRGNLSPANVIASEVWRSL